MNKPVIYLIAFITVAGFLVAILSVGNPWSKPETSAAMDESQREVLKQQALQILSDEVVETDPTHPVYDGPVIDPNDVKQAALVNSASQDIQKKIRKVVEESTRRVETNSAESSQAGIAASTDRAKKLAKDINQFAYEVSEAKKSANDLPINEQRIVKGAIATAKVVLLNDLEAAVEENPSVDELIDAMIALQKELSAHSL